MRSKVAMVMIAAVSFGASVFADEVKKPGNDVTVIEKKTSDGPREAVPNAPEAEYGLAPRVTLSFPSTIAGNVEVRGTMSWTDSDDKVVSVFLTIFFHDGDAATITLFDTRQGDIAASRGRITFGITAAGYNPPLGSNGFVFVTVTDQTLNITQMSTTFLVR